MKLPSCWKRPSQPAVNLPAVAGKKIDTRTRQINADKSEHQAIITAFFEALRLGDTGGLESLLSQDVIFHADGGGKAAASRKILQGFDTVCRFLVRAVTPSMKPGISKAALKVTWFNGTPGGVLWINDEPASAFNFVIKESQIVTIHALRNPDKLKTIQIRRLTMKKFLLLMFMPIFLSATEVEMLFDQELPDIQGKSGTMLTVSFCPGGIFPTASP